MLVSKWIVQIIIFSSDLTQIDFSEDIAMFFDNTAINQRAVEKMKLFYSKYENFVVSIKIYDNKSQIFSLYKDELNNEWLDDSYKSQIQPEIKQMEVIVPNGERYDYYYPVLKDNSAVGNVVVTLDYKKYFSYLFSKFNLKDYQWQWVINDTGAVIFDNSDRLITYSNVDNIFSHLEEGSNGNIVHQAKTTTTSSEIISSYYSTQLLQKDFGLVLFCTNRHLPEVHNKKLNFYCAVYPTVSVFHNCFIQKILQIET